MLSKYWKDMATKNHLAFHVQNVWKTRLWRLTTLILCDHCNNKVCTACKAWVTTPWRSLTVWRWCSLACECTMDSRGRWVHCQRTYTGSQNNAPTLASCSFDKHWLILIIFGKQHQHTFKNDMLVQLSLSLHVYLLYLLLNSCNGNK